VLSGAAKGAFAADGKPQTDDEPDRHFSTAENEFLHGTRAARRTVRRNAMRRCSGAVPLTDYFADVEVFA